MLIIVFYVCQREASAMRKLMFNLSCQQGLSFFDLLMDSPILSHLFILYSQVPAITIFMCLSKAKMCLSFYVYLLYDDPHSEGQPTAGIYFSELS